MADGIISPCNVACGAWLWDDMSLNSHNVRHIAILLLVSISSISGSKRPFYIYQCLIVITIRLTNS